MPLLPIVVTDPDSNRQSLRLYMAQNKRRYSPKYRPKIDALAFTHCVGCRGKLYAFKDPCVCKCVNPKCKHYGRAQ